MRVLKVKLIKVKQVEDLEMVINHMLNRIVALEEKLQALDNEVAGLGEIVLPRTSKVVN